MASMTPRDELAAFLRVRRAGVSPTDVGLLPGRRRRTPGLRREEVALLAGVSVSWYTWLEQGRPINASSEVLDAIARALALNDDERLHLRRLAGTTADNAIPPPVEAPESLVVLLDALEPHPASVLGPTWQFLAWNRSQARLWPALSALPATERNLLWVLFAVDEVRTLVLDWPAEARRALAQFRAETEHLAELEERRQLVARLGTVSSEFATWWAQHDVAAFRSRLRRYQHPRAGPLVFQYQQMAPLEWPGLRVVVHLPVPGDDSAQRLAAWHVT
jgi:transcriptional regulator with XRE-family HTH domain